MNVCIIGTGYVGLTTGVCFAELGNTVWCIDTDHKKIELLNQDIIPIYEPGMKDLVAKNKKDGRLMFSPDIRDGLVKPKICFIAVGTPMNEDGSADLKYVLKAARDIGENMTRDMIVVNKSTVPVGTANAVEAVIKKALQERNAPYRVCVVSNPEFLKEGKAIADCISPDRIVIGTDDEGAVQMMKDLYGPFVRSSERILVMDAKSAEMTKYASNAMLAARISFMNEIAGICEAVGANVNKVRLGMGGDQRIGHSFLYAGCGYGGSCFPKDVRALAKIAAQNDCSHGLLEQIQAVNERQKYLLAHKVIKRFGEDLEALKIAVWGLTFKPDTNDMREAPSITVIRELLRRGAKVAAFDPIALPSDREAFLGSHENLSYAQNKYEATAAADALILVTEWKEFRSPDFERLKCEMKTPVIFDGRNQYNSKLLAEDGFEYYPVGVGKNGAGKR